MKIRIYGNGKLVTPVMTNGKYRNWNALMSKTPKGRITTLGAILHKAKGSVTFETIRK